MNACENSTNVQRRFDTLLYFSCAVQFRQRTSTRPPRRVVVATETAGTVIPGTAIPGTAIPGTVIAGIGTLLVMEGKSSEGFGNCRCLSVYDLVYDDVGQQGAALRMSTSHEIRNHEGTLEVNLRDDLLLFS